MKNKNLIRHSLIAFIVTITSGCSTAAYHTWRAQECSFQPNRAAHFELAKRALEKERLANDKYENKEVLMARGYGSFTTVRRQTEY